MMGFGGVVQSFEHCPQGFEHSPKPSAKRVTAEAAEVEREKEPGSPALRGLYGSVLSQTSRLFDPCRPRASKGRSQARGPPDRSSWRRREADGTFRSRGLVGAGRDPVP